MSVPRECAGGARLPAATDHAVTQHIEDEGKFARVGYADLPEMRICERMAISPEEFI